MDHDLTCAQRHSGSNLYPHGADRKVLVSSQIESSSGLRHTPDQDHAAKQIIRTIKTNDKICTEKLAAERGVEEIGDQFFDATEVCSDENANEDDRTGRKDEVELQLRISGNYFILDGCEFGHESSTDEDVSSSIIPQSTEGGSSMDYSSPNTSDGMPADTGGSPFQGVLRPESESHQCPGALLKNPLSNNNISATSSGGMWTDTSSSSLLGSVGTDPCSSSLEGSMWTNTSSSPLAEKARRDPGSTSYPGDLLQLHTGILEEPCYTAENTSFSAESYGRILQYIQIIDADLQHLKDVEEEYHALRQRLTGSANQEQPSNES